MILGPVTITGPAMPASGYTRLRDSLRALLTDRLNQGLPVPAGHIGVRPSYPATCWRVDLPGGQVDFLYSEPHK